MMAPRWHKVRRDLTHHLPRSLLVAVAIATALAGAGTILTSWALVQRTTRLGFLASNPVAATLRLSVPIAGDSGAALDAPLLQRLRSLPEVRDVQPRIVLSLPLLVQGSWRPVMLFAAETPAALEIGRLASDAGPWPPPPGAIAIEHSSRDFAGTFVGDSLAFTDRAGVIRSVPVTSIVRDVSLAPGWMEHLVYAWTSRSTLEQLGLPSAPNELQLTVRNPRPTRDEVRRVAAVVREALQDAGIAVREVDVPEPGVHIHAPQMDSLLMTQGAFAVLALVVGGFLVVNLMSAMLATQGRAIGVMKVLGGAHHHLAAMYLVFATGIGAAATAMAVPVAVMLGRRYAAFRADLLNFDVSPYLMPWWSVALVGVVGLLVPLAAAWFPVRQATRRSVAESLRDVGLVEDVPLRGRGWFAARGGTSRVFSLTLRNAFRRRQRLVLTMLTLAGGGSVYVAAGNLRRAVSDSLDLIFGSQRYTASVRLAEPHDADSLERVVSAVAGVTRAEAWTSSRSTVVREGMEGVAFPLTGVPNGSTLLALDLSAGGRTPADGQRELVVNRSLQRAEPALAVGSTVELALGGRQASWRVVGAFDGGPAPTAYTSAAALAAERGDGRRGTIMVATSLTGVASQVDLVQRVRGALGEAGLVVANSTLLEESRRVTEDHLLMVVDFLTVMGWVMLVVGGMGLASTMALAVLERRREIGIMRTLGARHGALVTLIEGEGLVIALLGWAVAIPLSLPVSAALAVAFSRIMLPVPVYWLPDAASVLRWLLVVVVTSVVACAWPALRALRLTVARTLAYE